MLQNNKLSLKGLNYRLSLNPQQLVKIINSFPLNNKLEVDPLQGTTIKHHLPHPQAIKTNLKVLKQLKKDNTSSN